MVFFSPDTDALVLVIANYGIMVQNTSISKVSKVIEQIKRALVPETAVALPAFHALIDANNTGRFSHIGKTT